MKIYSLLCFIASALVVLASALRIMHKIEPYVFHIMFGISMIFAFWANTVKKKSLDKRQE